MAKKKARRVEKKTEAPKKEQEVPNPLVPNVSQQIHDIIQHGIKFALSQAGYHAQTIGMLQMNPGNDYGTAQYTIGFAKADMVEAERIRKE